MNKWLMKLVLCSALPMVFSCKEVGSTGGEEAPNKTFVDSRDNQSYKYVELGEQVWMAENLNYQSIGSYCFDEDKKNCNDIGALYTWGTAMDGDAISSNSKGPQGICPIDWHLPTQIEWEVLADFVNNKASALKSSSGWFQGGGSDDYGFNAKPSGYRDGAIKVYVGDTNLAGWFTSTQNVTDATQAQAMFLESGLVSRAKPKINAYAIRCVKD